MCENICEGMCALHEEVCACTYLYVRVHVCILVCEGKCRHTHVNTYIYMCEDMCGDVCVEG